MDVAHDAHVRRTVVRSIGRNVADIRNHLARTDCRDVEVSPAAEAAAGVTEDRHIRIGLVGACVRVDAADEGRGVARFGAGEHADAAVYVDRGIVHAAEDRVCLSADLGDVGRCIGASEEGCRSGDIAEFAGMGLYVQVAFDDDRCLSVGTVRVGTDVIDIGIRAAAGRFRRHRYIADRHDGIGPCACGAAPDDDGRDVGQACLGVVLAGGTYADIADIDVGCCAGVAGVGRDILEVGIGAACGGRGRDVHIAGDRYIRRGVGRVCVGLNAPVVDAVAAVAEIGHGIITVDQNCGAGCKPACGDAGVAIAQVLVRTTRLGTYRYIALDRDMGFRLDAGACFDDAEVGVGAAALRGRRDVDGIALTGTEGDRCITFVAYGRNLLDVGGCGISGIKRVGGRRDRIAAVGLDKCAFSMAAGSLRLHRYVTVD